MEFRSLYEQCALCPRECGVDRTVRGGEGRRGVCGQGGLPRVAYVGPHFGEEPPITGERGSGTVFFSGCSLRCSFCQNHQISHGGLGKLTSAGTLSCRIAEMVQTYEVHNVNFVTPDHFFPDVFETVSRCREMGISLPVVYNTSGYQKCALLRRAEPYVDIYLPDFKYSDRGLARRHSRCLDYPDVALDAIAEMLRQKGFLDSVETDAHLAAKGVLVRHLILPGELENSLAALTTLFLEFGCRLPLSLMSQYHPVLVNRQDAFNRRLLREEFDRVFEHAMDLGFEHLFVQFPGEDYGVDAGRPEFVPDFRSPSPFGPRR